MGFRDQVKITFAPGYDPQSVAIGDLDGDGKKDDIVVVANNPGRHFASVILGNGSGGFLPQATFSIEGSPISVAIGDLDGDGEKDDIVVANYWSRSVSVILGNGSGNFESQQTLAAEGIPHSVAIGDLDGDGEKDDIVVANRSSDTVSVILEDGSGGFLPQQTFAVGDNPNSLAIGDLDGDSNPDIVVVNQSSNTVSLLLGDSGGGFLPQQTFAVGNSPHSIAIGDLDGDRKVDDLAVANNGFRENSVSILIECFLTGTRILTDKGEIAVENFAIGDRVVTAEGKLEPIKWIGYQTIQPNQVKNPLRGYPILIKAGALGNNLPQRDLYVSPDHAMYFEGVLINAGALVNGTSIIKTEPKEAFTYYHVELENHALLLAEGASAESYLPQNEDRLAYENGAEYEELYPHGSNLMLWPMDYPRISSWVKVPRYMRKKLNAIAEELGFVVKAA